MPRGPWTGRASRRRAADLARGETAREDYDLRCGKVLNPESYLKKLEKDAHVEAKINIKGEPEGGGAQEEKLKGNLDTHPPASSPGDLGPDWV